MPRWPASRSPKQKSVPRFQPRVCSVRPGRPWSRPRNLPSPRSRTSRSNCRRSPGLSPWRRRRSRLPRGASLRKHRRPRPRNRHGPPLPGRSPHGPPRPGAMRGLPLRRLQPSRHRRRPPGRPRPSASRCGRRVHPSTSRRPQNPFRRRPDPAARRRHRNSRPLPRPSSRVRRRVPPPGRRPQRRRPSRHPPASGMSPVAGSSAVPDRACRRASAAGWHSPRALGSAAAAARGRPRRVRRQPGSPRCQPGSPGSDGGATGTGSSRRSAVQAAPSNSSWNP